MARCQVTFEEVATPARADDRIEVELGPPPPPAWRGRAGLEERRRLRPRNVVAAVALALLAWAAWPAPVAPPGDRAADERAIGPAPVRTPATGRGTVTVEAADVIAPPWSGVFEHHPDARGAVSVARVHVIALAGAGGERALFVVDATHRAFGDPERGWRSDGDPVRVLGRDGGTGLRTIQWDADAYGIALTTVGLTPTEQRRLAAALVLPDGPALTSGRAPTTDEDVLRALGLERTDARSGPGEPVGSPLIGQAGGASIDGLVHLPGGPATLVSVVQDQLVSAARVRRALEPHADVPAGAIEGASSAALLVHDGPPSLDRRVRGWNRLLIDHPAGVTIEVSSDALGGEELLAVARGLDLDRLARTVAPRG